MPRILFLPRSGAHGIGEYVRCLTLAQALAAREPAARIHFALRDATRLAGDDFTHHALPRDAAQGESLGALLASLRPHLVVTNNRGRQRELAGARAGGAAVVAISSTGRRSRARRIDVLRSVDQLWIVPGEGLASARRPARWRRLLAGLPHCEIVETLHPLPDPVRAAARRRELGLDASPYVLFAAGGGGWRLAGRPAPDVFDAAAAQVARAGARAVVVAGPLRAAPPAARDGVQRLGPVAPAAMVDLVAGAALVVCSGGGLLGWVLSLARPCITTPMPCEDQLARTARCRAAGTARVADGSADALAGAALELLRDETARASLALRLALHGPRNALPRCVGLLEELLRARLATSARARLATSAREPQGTIQRGSAKPPIENDEPEGSDAAVESSSTTSRPA